MKEFFWAFALVLGLFSHFYVAAEELPRSLRIGLTPTIPSDQYQQLDEWRRYMERRLGRRIEFVRRDSYMEAMELLRNRKLDFAWICDYPYVYFKRQLKLVAVPSYQGRPYYRSYIIVPSTDVATASLSQLKGKIFAYTDPYSTTGYLSPRFELVQSGENPSHFFRKTFFVQSHRRVLEAVASGLADGGAVSSHVWDSLAITKPELTAATRIVEKSGEYGFSPLVARSSIGDDEFRGMQKLLLDMAMENEGRALLKGLNLDGFIHGDAHLFEAVEKAMRVVGEK